jgi:hypothetical protein
MTSFLPRVLYFSIIEFLTRELLTRRRAGFEWDDDALPLSAAAGGEKKLISMLITGINLALARPNELHPWQFRDNLIKKERETGAAELMAAAHP